MFWQDDQLLRQINPAGQAAYDQLMSSGLYRQLVERGWLIEHQEVPDDDWPAAYKVIKPQRLPFISYPYEWSFTQYQDAALLTLSIQQLALQHGMTLRDASAYNIQLHDGQLRLIDTLSFDIYQPGQPWQAYRQFCQHFLAPLLLMSYRDPELGQLMRVYLDGLPLPLVNKLLPSRAKLRAGVMTHLGMHVRYQQQYQAEASRSAKTTSISQSAQAGLLDSLRRIVRSLSLAKVETAWANYYDQTNYSTEALDSKAAIVSEQLKRFKPKTVLDLGANNGHFSRLASQVGATVISADIDPLAVNQNYRQMKLGGETNLYPLLVDLTNPSPAIGWANAERLNLTDRVQSDVVMALALIHHLAIAGNLPLAMVADYFCQLGPNLIIEFVPKTDSQVQRLLSTREDIFPDYTSQGFEQAFTKFYKIVDQQPVPDSERVIYSLTRKG